MAAGVKVERSIHHPLQPQHLLIVLDITCSALTSTDIPLYGNYLYKRRAREKMIVICVRPERKESCLWGKATACLTFLLPQAGWEGRGCSITGRRALHRGWGSHGSGAVLCCVLTWVLGFPSHRHHIAREASLEVSQGGSCDASSATLILIL